MSPDYDIAIVGYGPVGQTAAILLGRLGYEVGVFERWPSLYPRPRAVHYDDEVARIFQHLGLGEQLRPITEPATRYEWQNASGQTLLLLDRTGPGPSGWPAASMFSQPQLEQLLDRTAKAVPSVEVHQGWELCELLDAGPHVTLSVRRGAAEGGQWVPTSEQREVTARYVVGCDGANSLVRERMGTPLEDLGFAFDWLIADTVPHDPGLLAGVNLQRCDPERPTTLVSGGPGRRRWEWMLLPGETPEQVEDPAFVWSMLARSGVGEADVTLERHAVYTFRARWAERWREGRVLLAGDAAHLMPPFAGQGMCSGIRDAFTLAWHLDLVLAGHAEESTLDAYTSERRGHLQYAIEISVALGQVICIADLAEAAARDAALLAAAADPSTPPLEPPPPVSAPASTTASRLRTALRLRLVPTRPGRCSRRRTCASMGACGCSKRQSTEGSPCTRSTRTRQRCSTRRRAATCRRCDHRSSRSMPPSTSEASTATGSPPMTAPSRSCAPTSTSSGRR